jgi:L-threonylcarbamoyladenylate synthase
MRYDMSIPGERIRGITAAAAACRRGDLVVLPTESVYGLGTDAFVPAGIDRLVAAKGRGRDLPVPVLVPGPATVDGLASLLPQSARDLISAFWPGPLTLVVRHHPSLAWDLGDANGAVALRMPLHPVALELLRETGPLAVTSANRSGSPAPTTVEEAVAQLDDAVSIYLDSGPCVEALPSTIVDSTGETPRVLRIGALGLELLRTVCPGLLGTLPTG